VDIFVITAGRQLLINIIIMKYSRPSKCRTKVMVEAIETPECPTSTLKINTATGTDLTCVGLTMKGNGNREAGCRAK
jgi:hypothetical protein